MKISFNITRIVLAFIAFAGLKVAGAQNIQRYHTFKYTVNEGLLQSTMVDIGFDSNNFCWLSFPNGIQKFDGKRFTDIPIQEGLPDNKWAYFFRCKNGDLLVSHVIGLSKYDVQNNKFQLVHRNEPGTLKTLLFLGEDEGIIYCISEQGTISGFNCSNYAHVKTFNCGIPSSSVNPFFNPTIGQNIINHIIGIKAGNELYMVNLRENKLQFPSRVFPFILSYFLWLPDEHNALFYEWNDSSILLRKHNFITHETSTISNNSPNKTRSPRSRIYHWEGKNIYSWQNHLYETNEAIDSIYTELVSFENEPISNSAAIVKILEDNFGNLYLQTIYDGFRKIIKKPYPIKYFGAEKREEGYTLSILADKKNNRVLAGTSTNGVMVFDTTQKLIMHVKTFPGEQRKFGVNGIIKNPNGDYILSVMGNKMWLLSKDLTLLKSLPVIPAEGRQKADIGYFAEFIFSNDHYAIFKSESKYFKIFFNDNKIREYESGEENYHGAVLFKGNIISQAKEKILVSDTVSFKKAREIPFTGSGGVRCMLVGGENELFIGSNKGVYKVDSSFRVLMHLDKNSGLPDECIYSMRADKYGNIWCSTNKGICRIDRNKNIFQLTKEDGLQENEFNTNTSFRSDDGELYFGGVNGISSFFPEHINESEEKLKLLFTSIKINNEDRFNDTAVWNISEIKVPYDQNAFSFDFIAIATNNPEQYVYQYKMESVDKNWSQKNDLQTVHYFLAPGKYVFKIYASRVFDKDAIAMKEIRITIHPPFWKTWWFITIASLFFILSLAYAINRYNRNKYQKKVAELESEHKIQLERERISRDLHDNIGAYASTVLYKTDLLQSETLASEKNELMNDLRFASKDIITSLRETIWALKKEQYDAQECLMRIRNFIQPFTRYYPAIRFTVNGDAASEKILHYTKALNLVRIVQEAVSNAIKHSGASNIDINSSMEEKTWKITVSDNGKGFDYEGKFRLQEGNGLNNMKQRALESGFDLILESNSEKGTSITIIV